MWGVWAKCTRYIYKQTNSPSFRNKYLWKSVISSGKCVELLSSPSSSLYQTNAFETVSHKHRLFVPTKLRFSLKQPVSLLSFGKVIPLGGSFLLFQKHLFQRKSTSKYFFYFLENFNTKMNIYIILEIYSKLISIF